MTKASSSIRQRRRLLNPPKTSAPSVDLTEKKIPFPEVKCYSGLANELTRPVGFVSPTVMEVESNRSEIERLKKKISKYKQDDENRRQGRKD